jgi:hypothetical protein
MDNPKVTDLTVEELRQIIRETVREALKDFKGKRITIADLGWTREQAIAIRGLYGSIAEDWDDPAMDIYDELY